VYQLPSVLLITIISVVCCTVAAKAASTTGDTELDEVVVTASLSPTKRSNVGSAMTVISQNELEQLNENSVADVLRHVPGVQIQRSGSFGAQTSVRLRGLGSEHTKVLVNGIEVNDPTSIEGSFDFANLSTSSVRRIEIVRGPQSLIHGSDAVGGVINVITREGRGSPKYYSEFEIGSHSSERIRVGSSGSIGDFSYSVGGERFQTTGFSTANDNRPGNTEKDGQSQETVTLKSAYHLTDSTMLSVGVRHLNAYNETDACAGTSCDDSSYSSINRNVYNMELSQKNLRKIFDQSLSVSVMNNDRQLSSGSDYYGNRERYRYQLNGRVLHSLNLVGAVESRTSSANIQTAFDQFDREIGVDGVIGQAIYSPLARMEISLGGRIDDHSRYGQETSHRMTVNYDWWENLRFHGSYGSGYKAPSLYQLYSNFGDTTLVPEENQGWDLGFTHWFNPGTRLDVTYFSNELRNLIGFSGSYSNVSGISETNGAEVSLAWRGTRKLSGHLNYTYTNAVDESGEDLKRRPEHMGSVRTTYDWLETLSTTVSGVYQGENEQTNRAKSFPYPTEEIPDFWRVNLSGRYQPTRTFTVTGRIQNLLDREYEEIFGYGTEGLSGYLGVKATF
jgi:vitamin B12 transporter